MAVNLQLFGGRGGSSGANGGFGAKGSPHSISQAVQNVNPHYGEHEEWSKNCQRVVNAYELYRQGYDVEARAKILNGEDKPYQNWYKAFKGQKWYNVGANTAEQAKNNIVEEMRSYGPNARAIVHVKWSNEDYAHVFNIETFSNGRTVRAYDAQSHDSSNGLLDRYLRYADTARILISRVDNLKPNWSHMKGLVKKKGNKK